MRKIKLSLLSGFVLVMAVCTNGYAEPIIPQTPTLNSNNAEMQVRFFSGNEPKIDYRKVFNQNFKMEATDLYFGNLIEIMASATKLNFIVDKDVSLARNTYTFYQDEQPFKNTFENLLNAECLAYQAITNRDKFVNQMRIYPVPTDTMLIYPNPAQKNCNQPDDFTQLSKYYSEFEKNKTMDIQGLPIKTLLAMLSVDTNTTFIYQNERISKQDYAIHTKDKPASKMFESLLKSQCLTYRKLTDESLLIFKDPNQKDCKPLPSGSEIIVK